MLECSFFSEQESAVLSPDHSPLLPPQGGLGPGTVLTGPFPSAKVENTLADRTAGKALFTSLEVAGLRGRTKGSTTQARA